MSGCKCLILIVSCSYCADEFTVYARFHSFDSEPQQLLKNPRTLLRKVSLLWNPSNPRVCEVLEAIHKGAPHAENSGPASNWNSLLQTLKLLLDWASRKEAYNARPT